MNGLQKVPEFPEIEKNFFECTCLPFNGVEVHGFKIVSKGAMTYIKDSAVGFILAIIIIPWM